VLATCDALTAPLARLKALDFACEPCAPDLIAYADREKTQQVVINLLSNAIKFTGAGGRVSVSCTAGRDRQVSVRVADTGRGIAAEQQERVFQPFVQIDARFTRIEEGTGLGLAISRDLARGMGGDLTVESAEGVGSTFTLTLPAG
jgi:signal transduction histidine kinase